MSPANSKRIVAIIAIACVCAIVLWVHFFPIKPPNPPIQASVTSPNTNISPQTVSESLLDKKLHETPSGFANASSTDKIKLLNDLRKTFTDAPASEASAAIRHFLDAKTDAPTGLEFKIGPHGLLTQAPTLRVFLLNCLGQIDPAAAAAYSRSLLNTMDSPDEWAVALQNLALGDSSPEARALMQQKLADLLQYQPWQSNPSTGYLEAFDAAVYLGGTNLIPTLTQLLRNQDNPSLAHASFLALDRMVINDPVNLLSALEAQPNLFQGREQTRADYFGRTDVRDSAQRTLLENYLLNPNLSPAELQTFTGIFPNANFMVSDNLLTTSPPPNHAELVARDVASLQTVQQWLADPRFQNLRPQLQNLQARLAVFVNQANPK